jgi:hypothetical protein
MPGLRPPDVYLLAHAGEAQVAPDGVGIAYSVSTLDPVTNGTRSRIWLAGAGRHGPSHRGRAVTAPRAGHQTVRSWPT